MAWDRRTLRTGVLPDDGCLDGTEHAYFPLFIINTKHTLSPSSTLWDHVMCLLPPQTQPGTRTASERFPPSSSLPQDFLAWPQSNLSGAKRYVKNPEGLWPGPDLRIHKDDLSVLVLFQHPWPGAVFGLDVTVTGGVSMFCL